MAFICVPVAKTFRTEVFETIIESLASTSRENFVELGTLQLSHVNLKIEYFLFHTI